MTTTAPHAPSEVVPGPVLARTARRLSAALPPGPEKAVLDRLAEQDAGATLLLAGPHFHIWRSLVSTAIETGDEERCSLAARLLGNLLTGPLSRDGEHGDRRLVTHVDSSSHLHLSGSGAHLEVPAGWRSAEITVSPSRVVVEGPDGVSISVARDALVSGDAMVDGLVRHPRVGAIECDSTDPLVDLFLRRNDEHAPVGPYPRRNLSWGTDARPAAERFREALDTIRSASPSDAADVESYVALIVPFEAADLVGFSSPLALGAVFVAERPGDPVHYVEHLLHETCHNALFRYQAQHRLHRGDTTDLVEVPWRLDRRPVIGAIHGTYVFGRLAAFFARARDLPSATPGFAERHVSCLADFRQAYAALCRARCLTPEGERLLGDLAGSLGAPDGR